MDLGPLLGLWLQSALIGFTMKAMGIIIFVLVYGRMLEIYLLTSLAPIPVATLSNRELGSTGQNYIKSLFAVGFQGLLILVCVAISRCSFKASQQAAIPLGRFGELWATRFCSALCCLRRAASPSASSGRIERRRFKWKKTTFDTSGQSVQKSPEGLFLQDGIAGLRSLPRHSVDMLLTDPPYGTTRNFWDVPLPLPELWEAVKWAVKPEGAVLFFAQCPYDKVLGASNLPMLRYEWVWYKSRCTGFLNARRAPLKKTENILVFYQKLPLYNPLV